jgi:hypothetical protein
VFLRYAGADDVEPVERPFSGDLILQPLKLEAGLLDRERKVLTNFVLVEDFADPNADFVAPGERSVLDPCLELL